MNDGSDKPSELTIDSSTGIFTLDNDATIKTTYSVNIEITTTDGTNSETLVVEDVIINKVCGPSSTTFTVPVMESPEQIPNYSVNLIVSGSFVSSNVNCQIQSHSLLTGTAYFTMTDDG
jgi:hypothetical protein